MIVIQLRHVHPSGLYLRRRDNPTCFSITSPRVLSYSRYSRALPRALGRNQSGVQGRQLVSIQEEKHGMRQEQYRGRQRCIRELLVLAGTQEGNGR